MSTEKHIYVYTDTRDLNEPLFLGILNSTVVRGKEIFSFEYSKEWLKNNSRFAIDLS
jgi:serine/threonine-protein kinase HipA